MSLSHAGQKFQAATMNESHAPEKSPSGSSAPQPSYSIHSGTGGASTVFDDSGFFESEQTNTPRKGYQDFILFDDDHHTTLFTDQIFADADSSVVANQGSIYDGKHGDTVQIKQDISFINQRTPPPTAGSYDAVRDSVQQSVNEAVTTALAIDYNEQLRHANSQSPPPTPYLRPLELWEHNFHRHESIAYRFEQTQYQVRAQRSRQERS